jgi:hypothetical protein
MVPVRFGIRQYFLNTREHNRLVFLMDEHEIVFDGHCGATFSLLDGFVKSFLSTQPDFPPPISGLLSRPTSAEKRASRGFTTLAGRPHHSALSMVFQRCAPIDKEKQPIDQVQSLLWPERTLSRGPESMAKTISGTDPPGLRLPCR